MTSIIAELAVNLYQSVLFIGFLFMFFEKRYNRKTNIISFTVTSLVLFSVMTLLNYFKFYVTFTDSLSYIFIMELYTFLFLRGRTLLKIIMPIFVIIISYIVTFLYGVTMSLISGVPFEYLISAESVNRYIVMIMINLTALFLFWMILRFKEQKIQLTKLTDMLAFIIIPLATLIIINCAVCIIFYTSFQTNILIYSLVICSSMISVTVIVFLLMAKISKTNDIETKLLLSKQKEYLYRENVLQTNTQIEKISKIKHDIQNHVSLSKKSRTSGLFCIFVV